jgi:hypothetical protein
MTQAAGVAALTGFGVRVLTARGDDLTGRGSCGDSVHIRLHSVDPFPRSARVHGIGPRDSACHSGKKIREEFGGRASIRARRLEALLEKTAKERA